MTNLTNVLTALALMVVASSVHVHADNCLHGPAVETGFITHGDGDQPNSLQAYSSSAAFDTVYFVSPSGHSGDDSASAFIEGRDLLSMSSDWSYSVELAINPPETNLVGAYVLVVGIVTIIPIPEITEPDFELQEGCFHGLMLTRQIADDVAYDYTYPISLCAGETLEVDENLYFWERHTIDTYTVDYDFSEHKVSISATHADMPTRVFELPDTQSDRTASFGVLAYAIKSTVPFPTGHVWARDFCMSSGELCRGDVNGDGFVTAADILVLLDVDIWDSDCTGCPEDCDYSSHVDVHDLLIALEHWGEC